jgi:wyosine [tRNA(Phe)-imidazoG37] synthetase (radical SAM superfamily)
VLPLKQQILYGPVNSRRYGRSLGINLMPCTYKLCSFNCVYCHFGWTKRQARDADRYAADMPAFQQVVQAVEERIASPVEFDLITFSGNGEPTLYPWFAELVDAVVRLRNRYRPTARVALLSNATGLTHEAVRRSVAQIDLPVFKLDAGTAKAFCAINHPARGIDLDQIVTWLAGMERICLQTVFVDGTPSNTDRDEMSAWHEAVGRIRPREVHIYSIDRPVPENRITLVPPERLKRIAQAAEKETGVPVRAFSPRSVG